MILPLTFVGGVFYSIEILPSPWEELSHANPLFYMVNTVRYGFLGDQRRQRRALLRRDRRDRGRVRGLVPVAVQHRPQAEGLVSR